MRDDPVVREIERFAQAIPEPHPSLRARVMAALPADDRAHDRPRWAVAAAVVLAGLIVGTLVLGVRGVGVRSGPPAKLPPVPSGSPAAPPSSSPVPIPPSAPLDVPDSTPVIALGSRTAAITWTGERGTLGVASVLGGSVYQSPDGSRFLVGSTVFDRRGAAVGDLPSGSVARPTWADDSRHLCRLGLAAGSHAPAILQVLLPGQPALNVLTISPSSTPTRIEACSVLTDRAVFSQDVNGAKRVSLVQLSTGGVLATHSYPVTPASTPGGPTGGINLVASRDGTLLAVMSGPFSPNGAGSTTTFVRLSDGAVLGQMAGRVTLGFSWDGELAVMSNSFSGAPSVVRWRTGDVLWTGGAGLANSPIAEPNGTHVAVGLASGVIWIVGPDGQARQGATNDLLPET
jgi:hypothetical protein